MNHFCLNPSLHLILLGDTSVSDNKSIHFTSAFLCFIFERSLLMTRSYSYLGSMELKTDQIYDNSKNSTFTKLH